MHAFLKTHCVSPLFRCCLPEPAAPAAGTRRRHGNMAQRLARSGATSPHAGHRGRPALPLSPDQPRIGRLSLARACHSPRARPSSCVELRALSSLNAFLTAALTLLPLALLGTPAPVLFVAAVLHNVHGVATVPNSSAGQPSASIPPRTDGATGERCCGNAIEINAAAATNPAEIHRQAFRPLAWNTAPDSTVPNSRPSALAM